ncbi:hypothetical protein ARMSODRAFT_113778 [Armillaria solidipes]|uniref:Uncharacterized protein n=1 Tax=Armillaria solidipes TaxID=1076256 RepID=A0A2H3BNI1_9AGAR|nr:hypothetical protein ARMSODRAFT_113778 [Armillaria solidipes]
MACCVASIRNDTRRSLLPGSLIIGISLNFASCAYDRDTIRRRKDFTLGTVLAVSDHVQNRHNAHMSCPKSQVIIYHDQSVTDGSRLRGLDRENSGACWPLLGLGATAPQGVRCIPCARQLQMESSALGGASEWCRGPATEAFSRSTAKHCHRWSIRGLFLIRRDPDLRIPS